jgi:hypothetical protein
MGDPVAAARPFDGMPFHCMMPYFYFSSRNLVCSANPNTPAIDIAG